MPRLVWRPLRNSCQFARSLDGLPQGTPDVLARVDLAVQDGDELVLTDFKTSRSHWNANQAQSNAEQLLLYADLAGRVLDGKRIKLQFAVVTKTKTPVLEVHEVCYDAGRLKRSR